MPTPDKLDSRSYQDLVDQLESRIQEDTESLRDRDGESLAWRPRSNGKLDVGGTLVRLFARMMDQLLARLNQVPERHHLAFLDLLGTERLPPAAARVPLTFTPAAPSPLAPLDPVVPAQTAVAAPAEGTLPEAVFYTEEDLVLTRAELVAAFTRQPDSDRYSDVTAVARGTQPGAFPAFGGDDAVPIERALFVACDALLADQDLSDVAVSFSFASAADAQLFAGQTLAWSRWDGQAYAKVGMSQRLAGDKLTWQSGALLRLVPCAIAGQTACWLRAALRSPLAKGATDPPAITKVTISATARPRQLAPAAAFLNDTTLDLSQDFQPFGNSPRLYDTFYLCGGAELLSPGGVVTLHAVLSDTLWGSGASTIQPTPDFRLSFELWRQSAWAALPASSISDDTAGFSFAGKSSPERDLVLTLPTDLPAFESTTINGTPGAWLRVRIMRGGYGPLVSSPGGAAVPQPSQLAPIDASWQSSWRYVVVALGPSGTLQPSDPYTARGPATLDNTGNFITLRWAPVAGAASYSIYRIDGPAPAAMGFIGATTGTLFVDVGQAPGATPAGATAPARPSLKSLTVEFSALTRTSDAQARLVSLASVDDGAWRSWTDPGVPFAPFRAVTDTEPALYLGFDHPFANRAVALFLKLDPPTAQEVSADAPTAPQPLVLWEYYSREKGFVPLQVIDDTLTLTRGGLVRFIGPLDFADAALFSRRCYWLRARLFGKFQPPRRLCRILTNTTWAVHAKTVVGEVLGSSNEAGAQTFQLSQRPVLSGERIEVREPQIELPNEGGALDIEAGAAPRPGSGATSREVWSRWQPVPDFHGSGPLDRHYAIDRATGLVQFGNGRSGRVPMAGARNIRAASYRSGGGAAGNRAVKTIAQLKSTIAYVESAVNHQESAGGADAEELARWKLRSATNIRHRNRAVTVEDYENLALAASPLVARARAIGATLDPIAGTPRGPGRVLVLIVPFGSEERPVPGLELIETVRAFLVARSEPAVTIQVGGPSFHKLNVAGQLAVSATGVADQVQHAAVAAIRAFLHPLSGNVDGRGWDFGRMPHKSDLYRMLASISGLDSIPSLQIELDPALDERLLPTGIIFPGTIELRLVSSPGGGA